MSNVDASASISILVSSRQIEKSISILDFFPPNRGVDFYFEFLPIEKSISILNSYLSIKGNILPK
jgi:hypothetical protein